MDIHSSAPITIAHGDNVSQAKMLFLHNLQAGFFSAQNSSYY